MNDRIERVVSAASARMPALLPLLERWVRTNSYSANIDGVNAVGELMIEDFDFAELALERVYGEGVGDHLVWATPAWSQGGGVLLVGHHDTVFPPGAFEVWEHDGDRLRGPGVLDMKGGLATVWAALAALHDVGALAELPLAFVSVGDEEIGSPHSRKTLERLAAKAAVALVFEAGRTEDQIITQRKGTGGMNVRVKGRAAHAGNHHAEGINAIAAVCQLVTAAQAMTDYQRGITVNVGLIAGGEARNTVPGTASCGIDFRFESSADGRAIEEQIRADADAIGKETGTTFTIDGGVRRLPLERSEASVALYHEYAQCAAAVGLGSSEAGLLGGGSDANTVSAVGVPAIDGLGPRGRGFHTHDEHIEVSTLAQRVEALARFLAGRVP